MLGIRFSRFTILFGSIEKVLHPNLYPIYTEPTVKCNSITIIIAQQKRLKKYFNDMEYEPLVSKFPGFSLCCLSGLMKFVNVMRKSRRYFKLRFKLNKFVTHSCPAELSFNSNICQVSHTKTKYRMPSQLKYQFYD